MESFDGTESCQLVGLFVFHIFGSKCRKYRTGLYCDDAVASLDYTSRPKADRIRKDFIKIFIGRF